MDLFVFVSFPRAKLNLIHISLDVSFIWDVVDAPRSAYFPAPSTRENVCISCVWREISALQPLQRLLVDSENDSLRVISFCVYLFIRPVVFVHVFF